MEAQHKILMVDDEQDLEQLVRQRMRREIRSGKYSFVFAHDGVEALEVIEQHDDIDLVLSDINMPRMDGLTLLEKLPDVDTDLRSVVISAYGDIKNIRAAMNRGAFDFVTKPIDFDDLRVTVERGLQQLEMWREAEASRSQLMSLQSELDVANSMQQSILPKRFPENEHYELFGSMEPARNVGGDFFDIIRLEDGRIGIAIADVSDKGIPAALFMMSSRTLLKGAALGCEDPATVVAVVNEQLNDGNEANMFVTLFYAVYDPATGRVHYANGGHNPPLIVHPDGSSSLLPLTEGVALGVVPNFDFGSGQITLKPGEALFLYTDGVSEAENADSEEYGMERLQAVFAGSPPESARAANDAVFASVRGFAGDRSQSDDITCLVLRRTESKP
ncbi:PP2C family protein-serine/threonine phosphatase [Candidatus Foliamicus sp.]